MGPRSQPSAATRVIGALLAAVWIGGGLLALAVGAVRGGWLLLIAGAATVWYGLVWVRVAREGRQLRWPEGLLPWRRS